MEGDPKEFPDDIEELVQILQREVCAAKEAAEQPDAEGYNRTIESIYTATLATFRFISSEVNCTGYQAGAAALQFLQYAKHIYGPFKVICAKQMVYPQYNVLRDAVYFLTSRSRREWVMEKAEECLESSVHGAEHVREHWEVLKQLDPANVRGFANTVFSRDVRRADFYKIAEEEGEILE